MYSLTFDVLYFVLIMLFANVTESRNKEFCLLFIYMYMKCPCCNLVLDKAILLLESS